jgi:hypothetical protein
MTFFTAGWLSLFGGLVALCGGIVSLCWAWFWFEVNVFPLAGLVWLAGIVLVVFAHYGAPAPIGKAEDARAGGGMVLCLIALLLLLGAPAYRSVTESVTEAARRAQVT